MTVFRWIMGSASALMALAWLALFLIALWRGDAVIEQAARRARQWMWMALLLWLNLEIWGRVVWTLLTW